MKIEVQVQYWMSISGTFMITQVTSFLNLSCWDNIFLTENLHRILNV